MKKWAAGILCLTGLMGNSLFGDDYLALGVRTRPSPIEVEEQEPVITPSARECPKRSCLFTTVDFLYWRPWQDDMVYALLQLPESNGTGNIKIAELDYEWSPGFRLGLGYNLPYDGWDIGLAWTWYQTSASSHLSSTDPSIVPVLLTPPVGSLREVTKKASSHWSLHFNVLDFQIGRHFFESKRFSLRPAVGLKTAWIHEKWKTSYGDLFEDDFIKATKSVFLCIVKDWSIGPEVGINGKWHVGGQWSILGDVGGAILYHYYDLKSEKSDFDLMGEAQGGAVKRNIQPIQPMVQLALGLGWGKCFGKQALELSAAYEFQYWWNESQFVNFSNLQPHGSLALSGLSVSMKIDF